MFENDALTDRDQRSREHELWLAMQAAHHQWMNATEALDDFIGGALGDVPSPDESFRIAKVAEAQRVAFEEYIEARLAFSEFMYERDSGTGTGPSAREDPKQWFDETAPGSLSGRTTSTLTVLALAVALLCPAVFGLAYLAHERKHIRDLTAARDAMNSMLTQARSQTSTLGRDAANSPQQVKAAPAPAVGGSWRSVKTPPPQQRKQTKSIAKQYPAPVRPRQRTQRHNYEFTLTPSQRYSRIGPVKVSLHNLDRKHDYFDLSMMLGDFRLDRKHVRPSEPVWINLGGSSTPIRLVADRIRGNEVHGYLSILEPKPGPAQSRRITNAGSFTPGG
jgi:hypothetical protein